MPGAPGPIGEPVRKMCSDDSMKHFVDFVKKRSKLVFRVVKLKQVIVIIMNIY